MRGIIFDLDDTLYRRADFVRSGFDAVARHVAESWRREQQTVLTTLLDANANGRQGQELQVLCARLRLPLSVVPALVEVFRGHAPRITLDVAVRHLLQTLRFEGWHLAVLTNGDPGVQRRKVAALDLVPLVDSVVYAEEHAPQGKPDPAAFLVVLNRLQLPPARCVCVGDDPVCDISGARRIGLRTIRVAIPGRHPDLTCDADAAVDTVLGVPALASSLISEAADAA